ncbi:hypothetical protein ACFXG4_42295 [Nocardia sp. NPDC059246]
MEDLSLTDARSTVALVAALRQAGATDEVTALARRGCKHEERQRCH